MAGNSKKPRKKHNPARFIAALPVMFRQPPQHDRFLKAIPHAEFQKMENGTGNEHSYANLVVRLNQGLVGAQKFYTEEAVKLMDEALNAVVAVRNNWNETKKWEMTKEQATDILAGLNLTDEIQDDCSRRKFRDIVHGAMKGAQ